MKRSAAALLVLLAAGCGASDGSAVTIGGACTRTSDCRPGLTCVGGVCTDGDAGPPADAGRDSSEAGFPDARGGD